MQTIFVCVVGWCDDWKVVGASFDKATAQAVCDAAMYVQHFYDNTAKPDHHWIDEVPITPGTIPMS